ncbi:MAG: aldehyde-activating protein [Gammaproteobacteria bacterium]|nr:MAG: aldehyde-activating protein [Gammaproteobacteria bacterium]
MNGKCLCGKVSYQIEGDLGEVRLCHCSDCREVTGSAFSANAKIKREQFKLTSGTAALTEYVRRPGVLCYFCSSCGCHIYVWVESEPDLIRPRIGGLMGDVPVTIGAHVWVSSKASWFDITDNLPQFAEAKS